MGGWGLGASSSPVWGAFMELGAGGLRSGRGPRQPLVTRPHVWDTGRGL